MKKHESRTHFFEELNNKLKKKFNAFPEMRCTVIDSTQEMLFRALPCVNKVSFGFDDASALDNDGVAQDPLEPPVCHLQVPAALLHGLLKAR